MATMWTSATQAEQQGFNSNYYLTAKAAQLTASTGTTWTVEMVQSGFAAAGLEPYQHYQLYGYNEGLTPNAYFNVNYYVASKAAAAGVTEAAFLSAWSAASGGASVYFHYTTYGAYENSVNPSNAFDDQAYYEEKAAQLNDGTTWQQVRDAFQAQGLNAISHYQLYGQAEGLTPVPVDPSGQTFTLTTNMDTIVGGSGNDIVGGVAMTTLQAFDSINGGGGTNTLKAVLSAAYTGGATITNIQNLELSQTGAFDFNATGISGLQTITDNGGSGGATTVAGVGSVVNMGMSNTSQNFGINYANNVLSGSSDSMTLTVNNATGAARATITQATAAVNSIETLNIVSTGSANSIRLATDASQTSLKTINISGSQDLTLALAGADNVATSATTINAADLTGALDISGFGAAAHTVTGGSGNDVFQFGANYGTTDVINGGAGTNTLSANGAQLAAITTVQAGVSNIQTLMIADDVGATATTINATNFGTTSQVSNIRIADQGAAGAAAITVNNLVAAATGVSNDIRLDGDIGATGGTLAFNIKSATDPGTANSVNLDLRGGATTATSTIALAGVETVSINTTNASGAKTFTLNDAALTTLTVSGVQAVDLDSAALGGNVSSINASGLSASFAVALSSTATTGANITATSYADTVLGSNLKDIIGLGAGNDTVTGSGGQDVITLGSGTDTFAIGTAGAVAVDTRVIGANGVNTVSITDFVAGTDKISLQYSSLTGVTFTGTGDAFSPMADALSNTTQVNSMTDVYTQLGSSLTAGNFAASAAVGTATVARVVEFTSGSEAGKYLVINDATAGFQGATDIVIDITGVTGTVSAGDFTFFA